MPLFMEVQYSNTDVKDKNGKKFAYMKKYV